MNFKDIYFVFLIIPVIAFLLYIRFSKKERYFRINFPLEIPETYNFKVFTAKTMPAMIRLITLILVIIALSRPQKVIRGEIPPTQGIDIMLTMDSSVSMAAIDIEPSRMEAAKITAKQFIQKRPNDRIGLTVFGGIAFLSCPLTLDHNALTDFIERVNVGITQADGTAIGDGLLVAINHLKKSKAKSKIIVLLTDGRSNTGTVQDPLTAARIAKEMGIKIYTIGIGKKGESKLPTGNPLQPYITIKDDLNEPVLMEIAKITGGQYYRATSMKELETIYDEINKLEKTEFERKHFVITKDLYNNFLIPAIILTALLIVIEKTFILTVP